VKEGAVWTAEILRRKTSSESVVSKKQEGFKTEAEATSWAEDALNEFTSTQAESNKRHSAQRQEKKSKYQVEKK
jgi:hypothetical protein